MDFRILGPVEVVGDDGPLPLGGSKQKAVLGLLLVHRGEIVSSDRLIAGLWGERPPATAAKTVQVYVSRLRKAFGDGVLETHGHGYRLVVASGACDVDRFEALVEDARRGAAGDDHARAAQLLREALALWRGPALSDVVFEPFAGEEAERLEELRLTALEERIRADLAGGSGAELVGELQQLVRDHPLREGPRAALMLALYRAGRQAEALQSYDDGRRLLDEELGLQPGRELQDLQGAILRHDPALGAARRVPSASRRRRQAWMLIGVGAAVLAATAIVALTTSGDDGRAERALLGRDVVAAIDPKTGTVAHAVRIPGGPARMAAIGGTVWVGSDGAETLSAIDGRRPEVARVVVPRVFPTDVAVAEGRLWVLDRGRGVVAEIRPAFGTVEHRIPVGGGAPFLNDRSVVDPWSIAVGAGRVWVADGTRRLIEIDPDLHRVARRIGAGVPLAGVVVAQGGVWAISGPAAAVLRIDPRRGVVTARIPLVSGPGAESPYPVQIDAAAGALWVLNANTGTVSRIDPAQRGVTATITIGVEHTPLRLAAGRHSVWVASQDGTLARIDTRTNAARTTSIAHSLLDVAVAGDRVWASAGTGPGANAGRGVATGGTGRVPGVASSTCSPVYHARGARADRLIVADLPLQGGFGFVGTQMSQAVLFYLGENGYRAGRFDLGLQICDHGSATLPVLPRRDKCTATARAIARDAGVVGVVGPFNSGCAAVQLPLFNRAPGGPLAVVSPTNTVVGLTRSGPETQPGEPRRYYPTGRRSYARVIAADDVQATANVLLARDLGLRRVLVLRDHDAYGRLLAAVFARAAPLAGVRVAGRGLADEPPRRIVARVRATRADSVFISGLLVPSSGPLVRALRRTLGTGVRILAPDGFLGARLPTMIGSAAEAMAVSVPGLPLERLPAAGRRFAAHFGRALSETPHDYSIYTAQATQVLLDAIARSDGRRASVAKQLLTPQPHSGVLGRFAITPAGDTTQTAVAIYRYTGGRQRLFRVISAPAPLLARVRARPQP